MSETAILPCTCDNRFQDSRYGKGKRVFNWGDKSKAYKCTVCGKPSGEKKKDEKNG